MHHLAVLEVLRLSWSCGRHPVGRSAPPRPCCRSRRRRPAFASHAASGSPCCVHLSAIRAISAGAVSRQERSSTQDTHQAHHVAPAPTRAIASSEVAHVIGLAPAPTRVGPGLLFWRLALGSQVEVVHLVAASLAQPSVTHLVERGLRSIRTTMIRRCAPPHSRYTLPRTLMILPKAAACRGRCPRLAQ